MDILSQLDEIISDGITDGRPCTEIYLDALQENELLNNTFDSKTLKYDPNYENNFELRKNPAVIGKYRGITLKRK